MQKTPTPGQLRTAAATAAKKRAKQERYAAELRDAGWTVIPPEYQPEDAEDGEEWGVIWPSGDDEIVGASSHEAPEVEARAYAAHFDPSPTVVWRRAKTLSLRTAWEQAPTV